jgi:hypothetical protein
VAADNRTKRRVHRKTNEGRIMRLLAMKQIQLTNKNQSKTASQPASLPIKRHATTNVHPNPTRCIEKRWMEMRPRFPLVFTRKPYPGNLGVCSGFLIRRAFLLLPVQILLPQYINEYITYLQHNLQPTYTHIYIHTYAHAVIAGFGISLAYNVLHWA